MKKIVAIILAAVFCISIALTAAAEPEVKIAQKNFCIVESDWGNYGYTFAIVENTGSEPAILDNGKLVVFGSDDEIAATDDYVYSYPNYLEPGQFAIVYDSESLDITSDECQDFKFSIKTTDSVYSMTKGFEADKAEVFYDEDSWTPYTAVAQFTNNTEDVLWDFQVVIAIFDEDDNLLCTDQDYTYDLGLLPGSTILYNFNLDEDVLNIYEEQFGVKPAKAKALLVYEVEE